MRVVSVERDRHPAVAEFYASLGYRGGVAPDDHVLVAEEWEQVVGVVRLCPERGRLVLRGLYVAEDRRGAGVGRSLLGAASSAIGGQECWCIPFTHLRGFYESAGFAWVDPAAAPSFLAERRSRYEAAGQDALLMRRPAARALPGGSR